jgi:hypothetical protein
MHQDLEWFPAVGTCIIAGSSHKELHAGSSIDRIIADISVVLNNFVLIALELRLLSNDK